MRRGQLRRIPGLDEEPDVLLPTCYPGPMVQYGSDEPFPLADLPGFTTSSDEPSRQPALPPSSQATAPETRKASTDPLDMVEAQNGEAGEPAFWLVKAEPDSRIVKGKDVAFSVDHFEAKGTDSWEGVRNAQAGKYMKSEMKKGDKVLFYHSNTKVPGVAAFAEVSKEGYPDHSAWDPEHPYYDAKTDKDKPKWFMVDVTFKERVPHFVPLSLYKYLADAKSVPESLDYLTEEHLAAIKAMSLINRGRLSVQPVSKLAYEATELLGRNGGFDDIGKKPARKAAPKGKRKAKAKDEDEQEEEEDVDSETKLDDASKNAADAPDQIPLRQSQRKKART